MRCLAIMSGHNVKLARHFQRLVGQCPVTDCYFQHDYLSLYNMSQPKLPPHACVEIKVLQCIIKAKIAHFILGVQNLGIASPQGKDKEMKRTEIRMARIFHAKTHLVAQSGVFQMANNRPFSLEGRMETGCKSISLDQVDEKNWRKKSFIQTDLSIMTFSIYFIALL